MRLPPRPDTVAQLAPGLRRVLAENPSPMTYWGTNTYIVGHGEVAVIDPGPADPAHLAAIRTALEPGERISHILVTHAHLDHSPGARLLAPDVGAQVYAFGDAFAGRSPEMAALAAQGQIAGGEGVDAAFRPDHCLADGEIVSHGDWALEAIWTPGHFGNHMAFALSDGQGLICGDLVMGWSSSLVSPPDGDLAAFMSSLDRLSERADRVLYPGHGAPVTDPQARVSELRDHRLSRGAQIRAALREAPGSAQDLAARIYTDVPASLLPAAARNVLAHLIDFYHKGEVGTADEVTATAEFHAVSD